MAEKLEIPKEKIADFCRRNNIKKLSLFGSFLKGTAGKDSDIDFLVEFEKGKKPSLFGIIRMERELSGFFGGRKIDLRTPEDLSRYFRDEVKKTAEVQYAGS